MAIVLEIGEQRQMQAIARLRPTWSRDGTQIAFVRYYDHDDDITIINVGTGEVTRGGGVAPSWISR